MAQDKAQLQLNVQEIGLIGKDSNALYVGIAMTAALNNDTSVSVVSGVISITFVNSTIVNLGVYRELRDASSDYSYLLRRSKSLIAETIAAN